MTLRFARHELEMPQFDQLRQHLNEERERNRSALENPTLSESQSTLLRGEIQAIKKLLTALQLESARSTP